MFDNVGRDLDEEANKRRVQSVMVTVVGLSALSVGFLAATAWVAKEAIEEFVLDDDMVEVVLDDEVELAAPPPPPPPPPPSAGAEEEEEEEEEDDEVNPEDMQEEVEELDEKIDEKMKSQKNEAGMEGGQEGGVEGGVVGGVQGGVIGGVLGGTLGGAKVFHHSELEVKKRVDPRYPDSARELSLGEQVCRARVFMDEKGVPYDVIVEDCPKVFHTVTREAILKWRWYPPKSGKERVKAQTLLVVRYKLRG